ncbi:hypothetical protein RI129_006361 [Pyrocoelia pectoralis]|uniref:MICOS complex subunit MIC10 n=1 Tax=Pyrocoelia pectoralis TaxID=417401 RepID=A0AAN7VH34_9COLE
MASKDAHIYKEDQLDRKWNRCFTDGLLKFTGGFLIGTVVSFLFFKKRKWPMILGGGFGIGMAYSNCERDLNSMLQPVSKEC